MEINKIARFVDIEIGHRDKCRRHQLPIRTQAMCFEINFIIVFSSVLSHTCCVL